MVQHFNAINIEFLTEPEVKKPKLSKDGSFYIIFLLKKNQTQTARQYNVKLKIKGKLTRRNRGNDWTITQLCFQKIFNRKIKLDLKQNKRPDNSTRYFKQTLF